MHIFTIYKYVSCRTSYTLHSEIDGVNLPILLKASNFTQKYVLARRQRHDFVIIFSGNNFVTYDTFGRTYNERACQLAHWRVYCHNIITQPALMRTSLHTDYWLYPLVGVTPGIGLPFFSHVGRMWYSTLYSL